MKFIYLILLISLLGEGLLSAQKYDRSSVSLMLLEYNDQYDPIIRELFTSLTWGDERYDKNELPTKALTWPQPRISSPDSSIKTIELGAFLNQENIGKELIAYLYNRRPDGCMNAELINQRAAYNKTDWEYNIIQATAKKGSGMQEGGEQLIANSYIALYNIANIRYLKKGTDKEGNEGDFVWESKATLYLLRLKWTDELRNRFYEECWMDEETPEEEKEAIRQRFLEFQVPVEVVKRIESDVSQATRIIESRKESQARLDTLSKEKKLIEIKRQKQSEITLKDLALKRMLARGLSNLTTRIGTEYEPFNVKSAIYAVKPIRVKIGKKEGVKTGHRFFMYEYVLEDNGKKHRVRKGVIRATNKIEDNRKVADGSTTPTEFYQIAGNAAQPGWELVEKKSSGINVEAGYQMGNMNAATFGISGSIYGRKNFNHYLSLGFLYGTDKYEIKWDDDKAVTKYNLSSINLDYGYGLMKRNWEFYPYIGLGCYMTFKSEDENYKGDDVVNLKRPQKETTDPENEDKKKDDFDDEIAGMFNAGVRTTLNIYYPLQLFGAVEYSTSFYKGDTYKAMCKHKDIDKATSGIHYRFGLRICF